MKITTMFKPGIVLILLLLLLCCYLHSCAASKCSLQPLANNISIIHLSGTPQEIGAQHGTLLKENIQQARDAGGIGFLNKPICKEELGQAIHDILGAD